MSSFNDAQLDQAHHESYEDHMFMLKRTKQLKNAIVDLDMQIMMCLTTKRELMLIVNELEEGRYAYEQGKDTSI